jgi:membrane protein implicated in regulation of membrane protease activity
MKPKLRILATILLLFIFFALAWGNPGPVSRSSDPPWWFFAMIASIYCGAFLIMGVYYVLLILALVDIARAQNEGNWKLMWALISIFAGIIGIAVYYFVGRRDRLPPKPKATS